MRTGDDRLPILCGECGETTGWWVADQAPCWGDAPRSADVTDLDGNRPLTCTPVGFVCRNTKCVGYGKLTRPIRTGMRPRALGTPMTPSERDAARRHVHIVAVAQQMMHNRQRREEAARKSALIDPPRTVRIEMIEPPSLWKQALAWLRSAVASLRGTGR